MIRWLHISDLHISDKADWNNFKIEIVNKCKEIGKIDFMVVTGDFHNYSEGNNFKQAAEFLKNVTSDLGLNITEDLFVIPGNHDGVTEITYKDTFLVAARAEPLNIAANRLETLLGMFHDYDVFVKGLIPAYPVEQPSAVHTRVWRNQISLIHCNTAIAANGTTKDNQVLDIDGLVKTIINKDLPALILAHNSFFDLNPQQQDRIKGYIRNNHICAYLCGDTHINKVKQIQYDDNQGKQIPCVISFKSAPDPKDEYSRFGIIVSEWEDENAVLKGWNWTNDNGFKVDSEIFDKRINMRQVPTTKLSLPDTVKYVHPVNCTEWKLIDGKLEEQKAKNLDLSMRRFLLGYPCTWALAFSGLPVSRKQIGDLRLKIRDGGVFALLGAGAEGKSTLLKQLCVQLYHDGYTVIFHNERKGYELPDKLPTNVVVVVDEPDEKDFVDFLQKIIENEITLIFALRRNEWNIFCKRYNISLNTKRAVTEVDMEKIKDYEEAFAFADCIVQYHRPDADKAVLIDDFLHNSEEHGFLYAAMLLSIYDKTKFEEIAEDIIKKIRNNSYNALKLLGYAILTEQAGATFTELQYQAFLKKLSLKPKDAKDALELELQHKGNRRETRHPQISKLFYTILFGENGEFKTSDSDEMKYELLDFALNTYLNSVGNTDAISADNILLCINFINEVQNPSMMLQRIVEDLRGNVPLLQRIYSRISRPNVRIDFSEKCYKKNIINPQIIHGWAKAKNKIDGVGDYAQENSALWIYQEACINKGVSDSAVWLGWAQIEKETHGVGDYTQVNSTLWIYQEACVNKGVSGTDIWLGWAQIEKEAHGVGEYVQENSALWIYREACINKGVSDSAVWLGWAQIEKEAHGAGDYEQENSALCIYHEACINKGVSNSAVWLGWAQMEKETHGVGDYEQENSALWIYHEACINKGVSGTDIWLGWAQIEKEAHGAGDYTQENSALWIYREACINKGVSDSAVWLGWAQIEKEAHGAGEYEQENSALWIYHKACINKGVCDSAVWLGWVQIEKETHGVGEYAQENSALWIYHKACINKGVCDSAVWLGWAQIEKETHGAGDYAQENSALWIYREACINKGVSGTDIWLGWAKIEKETHGVGDYALENSALWIYHEACINKGASGTDIWLGWAAESSCFCNEEWSSLKILKAALSATGREWHVLSSYAQCLMQNNYFYEARRVFETINKNTVLSNLLIIEMVMGNNDNASPEGSHRVNTLVETMKKAVKFSMAAKYGLYMYYRFTKNKAEEEKFYSMLDFSSDDVQAYALHMEKFLENCLSAYDKPAKLIDSKIL